MMRRCDFLLLIFMLFSQTFTAQNTIISTESLKKSYLKGDLEAEDLAELIISDSHYNKHNKTTYVYMHQMLNGVRVYNAIGVSVVNQQNNILSQTQSFKSLKKSVSPKGAQSILAITASTSRLVNPNIQSLTALTKRSIDNKTDYTLYHADDMEEPLMVRPTYYADRKGSLLYCYEVNIWSEVEEKWYQYIINAHTSQTVDQYSWTIECDFGDKHTNCNESHREEKSYEKQSSTNISPQGSYNVFPLPIESPLYGGRSIETTPWVLAPDASPYGWHDLDGVAGADTTVTFGNNVKAYEDSADNDAPGNFADGGPSLEFDFVFDDSQNPEYYTDAAIVNLFYWNNIIHDITYHYGFTEEAGNFQVVNYTSVEGADDCVLAEAQDGSGTNNANFSTPPDGSNPRMQMYQWQISATPDTFEVLEPASLAGLFTTLSANFGPNDVSVLDTLVLVDPVDGCSAIINATDVVNNIAVMDRGGCTFVQKVMEAQNAGAIAVVICNNADDVFAMGGSDASIVIPAVMLSSSDCATIKLEMQTSDVVVEIGVGGDHFRDSDVDNGVIAHEYGHGISNRLTGGATITSCLFNEEQMGEGWSDYLAIMLTMDVGDMGTDSRGIGNYLIDEPESGTGIRPYPYSTDFGINPHTYADISSVSVPHGVGSVWCAMLWEMTWDLIAQYGYDSDIYNGIGGNNIALQLVFDGMKLQACSPGFVDGRDAILLADELNNAGANACLIWNAFARRGLGYSAQQGSSNSVGDGIEAFDLPPLCQEIIAVIKSGEKVITLADTIHYELYAFNNFGSTYTNVTLEDTLATNAVYVPGSLSGGSESGGNILLNIGTFNTGEDTLLTYSVTPSSTTTTIQYFDDIEQGGGDWTVTVGQGSTGFMLSSTNPKSGSNSWYIENVGADNTQYLEGIDYVVGEDWAFSFWHSFNTEAGWDGGYLEYSTDAGSTWELAEPYFILNPYNGSLGESSNSDIADKGGFTGNSGGYINSIFTMHHLTGQTVRVRFVFGSDNNTFDDGWYIDDISIYDVPVITNIACIHNAEGDSFCDTLVTYVTTDCSEFLKLYEDLDGDGYATQLDSIYACEAVLGYSAVLGDCDDSDDQKYPGNVESCDGIDNNCDGLIDETCSGSLVCQDNILYLSVNDVLYNIADSAILSTSMINALDSTFYYAGDTITLDIGFETMLGKEFNAIIENCTNN